MYVCTCAYASVTFRDVISFVTLMNTVEPPLTDILYSGHLIILDKMLRSELKLHCA